MFGCAMNSSRRAMALSGVQTLYFNGDATAEGSLERLMREASTPFCKRADGCGRRRPHCLHLRNHRHAQSRDALPSRCAGDLRYVLRPRAAAAGRRSLLRKSAAGVYVWPGRSAAVSAPRRRRNSLAGKGRPDRTARGDRGLRGHDDLHRAGCVPHDGSESAASTISQRCARASPPARRFRKPSGSNGKQRRA